MKVEIWSDVICPWCGLGQHRLDRAIADLPYRDEIEVVHHSFQLDPRASTTPRPVREMLAARGLSEAQLGAVFARVETLAAKDGLSPYIVGDNIVGNTQLAHELLALAAARGLEDRAWKHLYRAYFGEGRSIFDVDALIALGTEIGLDPTEVRDALGDHRYQAQVVEDGRAAQALGASGVPFVVVDQRYAVSGAQPIETFRQAIERARAERAP
jgi:predicted DsbA family dithiol-disulfide isomerase